MTAAQVRSHVRNGRWQRWLPRTFITHAGPVTVEAHVRAAVLYAGPGAVLSHVTAGQRMGLRLPGETVHVTVPGPRAPRSQHGVAIHRADMAAHEIVFIRGVATTSMERTVQDLLASVTKVSEALALVGDAVATRKTTAQRLMTALAATRVRWRRQVLDALHDVSAGSASGLEVAFARVLRRHGMPCGARQAPLPLRGGMCRVDMAYDGVVVELDGHLGHDSTGGKFRDMDRDNAVAVGGRFVLRFGWADVHERPCGVARQVSGVAGIPARRCGRRCAAATGSIAA
jgi:hypothetical protein